MIDWDAEKTCACCGEDFKRSEMEFTTDCYGIPCRLVCFDCYDKLMEDGYDGRKYTDGVDEYLDYY